MSNHQDGETLSLADAKGNSSGIILSLDGSPEFLTMAAGRGITPGTAVRIIQNYRIGPVIVYLRDSQIALGRSEARKITISQRERHASSA